MTQELDAFRDEARQWLTDNFPPALANKRPPGIAGFGAKFTGDWKIWQEKLGEKAGRCRLGRPSTAAAD